MCNLFIVIVCCGSTAEFLSYTLQWLTSGLLVNMPRMPSVNQSNNCELRAHILNRDLKII